MRGLYGASGTGTLRRAGDLGSLGIGGFSEALQQHIQRRCGIPPGCGGGDIHAVGIVRERFYDDQTPIWSREIEKSPRSL